MTAEARQRRRAALPSFKRADIPAARHGRRSTYVLGCRCDSCRDAEADYSRTIKRARA